MQVVMAIRRIIVGLNSQENRRQRLNIGRRFVLSFLHIRNLATVSELEIEFAPGLNVVTGETGAGKSLIMGALQALLGERADKSMIRHGESRCEIAAEFMVVDDDSESFEGLSRVLAAAGVASVEPGRLLVRRTLTPTSSRAYVNDSPVTLDILRAVGDCLVDIHGPHDHQSLLAAGCQLDLLDGFASLTELRKTCRDSFAQARECRREIEEIGRTSVDAAEGEILSHQLREIRQAALDPDEERRLHEQYRAAANSRSLIENAENCRQALSEADDSVVERLRPCVAMLDEIAQLHAERGPALLASLESVVGQIDELARDLGEFADLVELDGDSLRTVEERLEQIQRLRRKYGGTVEDVLRRADRLAERLAASEQREERLRELAQTERELTEGHLANCAELSRRRRAAAGELADRVSEKLRVLGFEDCRFEVSLSEAEPGPRGADRAVFMFAPNPGEGILPLRKIASSGEAARVMLGIKTVFSAVDRIPVLVFDEVDANIGGVTANQVAVELARLGRSHQIFCITHLPQIAAAGDSHYRVVKMVEDRRTLTEIHRIEADERLSEIVRMMGGQDGSKVARQHAKAMIGQVGGQV